MDSAIKISLFMHRDQKKKKKNLNNQFSWKCMEFF